MRIVLKLTAALAATGLVAFGVYALVALSAEDDELRSAAERDMRLLARSVQIAVENALRDDQHLDITETLQRLEQIEPAVDITVHDLKGAFRATSSGSLSSARLEGELVRRAMGDNVAVAHFEPDEGVDRLVVAVPIRTDDGQIIGGLTLARPLEAASADLARTRTRIVLVLIAFALASVVIGLLIGAYFVGRPMAGLLAGIRQARHGEPTSGLPVARADEIGMVAREFAQLLEVLAEEKRGREHEQTRRTGLERTLQHADKLITVGRLSARIAHEIGSPLQVLVGRAQAIAAIPGVDDKVLRHARIIAEQGERIVAIVRELLVWTRPPSGPPIPTNPGDEIRAVRDLLELEARQRQVALRERIEAQIPDIPIKRGQLQQVVFNLVKNALVVSPAGSTITIELARSRAPETRPEDPEDLVLTISDEGPGIDPALLPHLFEPFFSTRLDDGGLGLGLTIVRGIVEEHGGRVEVRSGSGGTSVIVRWPTRPPPLPAPAARVEPAAQGTDSAGLSGGVVRLRVASDRGSDP